MKGKVKSIETELFNFEIKNDSILIGQGFNSFDFDSYSLKEFDYDGFLIYEKTYESELKYLYDSSKRLVKLTEKYNNEKSPSVSYEYNYNEQDSLSKIIYKNDDFERKMTFKRDEKNRRIKRSDYVSDTIQMTFKVDYDKSGNIINENTYLEKSKPSKLISRTYSEQNLLLTENITEFRSYDTLNYKNIYLYNDDSKVIEIKNNFIDEIGKYSDKGFQSITKGGADLDKIKSDKKTPEKKKGNKNETFWSLAPKTGKRDPPAPPRADRESVVGWGCPPSLWCGLGVWSACLRGRPGS